MAGGNLVLLRHGESEWNRDGRFTGWRDIPLTARGEEEARAAARTLSARGVFFERAFTSYLRRAVRTLWLVLEESDRMWVAAQTDWRLNERHYGALQGESKTEAAKRFGKEQVFRWRRGYSDAPPAGVCEAPADGRYDGLDAPTSESLAQVEPRVWEFFAERAAPELRAGRNVLIVAHGNSLRALTKRLEGLSPEGTMSLNIETAAPVVYRLRGDLTVAGKDVFAK